MDKKLNVENVDLNSINDKMKFNDHKRILSKSMKNRLQSRTLLNRFIEVINLMTSKINAILW